MPTIGRKHLWIIVLFACSLTGWYCVLPKVWRVVTRADQSAGNASTVRHFAGLPEAVPVFHSDRADESVNIPFSLQAGNIVASVDLNGQTVNSIVDTGARDIIVNVDVSGKRLGTPFRYPMRDGVYVPCEYRELPSVRLGNYELANASVVVVPFNRADPDQLASTGGGGLVNGLIGNYAFKRCVLTIDYQSLKLTLHPSNYDITNLPHRRQDSLLDIAFGGNIKYSPEYLIAKGNFGGHKANILLDTGYFGKSVVLAPSFRNKLSLLPAGLCPHNPLFMWGQEIREFTGPLHWAIGNGQGDLPGVVLPLRADVDALVGYHVLKNYRVTIDYTRKKLLLEPYAPTQASNSDQRSEHANATVINNINVPSPPPGFRPDITFDPVTGKPIRIRWIPLSPDGGGKRTSEKHQSRR